MKNTALTALGGIISALSIFIMFLSGVIPFMTYLIPAVSGLLLIVTIREAELKWSVFIYCAVSALSLLVVADKEAAVMYTFFFGYYPIAKELIDRHINNVLIKWIVKFALFNVMIIIGYLLIIYIFAIPIEEMEEFGKYSSLVLLGLGNVTFIFYDIVVTNLNILYLRYWHKRLINIFKT